MNEPISINVPRGEYSPKIIASNTKLICCWNGKYYRGVETEEYFYFCNYQECDDNASVKMYRKSTLELICDNYHAFNDLMGVILDKTYTYLSRTMKFNAREMQKENLNN